MSITGTEQPTKVGVPIADLIAGMNGAYGVLAALHERDRTGRGRVVRTSLLAGMVGVHAFQGTRWTVAGEVPGLAGDHHPSIAPYGMFATATAPVQIACGSEGLWRALCGAFGWDAADAGFATNALRVAHRDALIARIEDALRDRARRALARRCSPTAGVPSGKVRSMDDVYALGPDALAGPAARPSSTPPRASSSCPGSPLRFDDNPFSGGRSEHLAPPTLGPARRRRSGSGSTRRWTAELGRCRRTGTWRRATEHRRARLDPAGRRQLGAGVHARRTDSRRHGGEVARRPDGVAAPADAPGVRPRGRRPSTGVARD